MKNDYINIKIYFKEKDIRSMCIIEKNNGYQSLCSQMLET